MARGFKTGGRSKGTPNQVTSEFRTLLADVLSKELDNLQAHLSILEPKERLEIIVKLLPFILPKAQTAAVDEDEFDEEIETTLNI